MKAQRFFLLCICIGILSACNQTIEKKIPVPKETVEYTDSFVFDESGIKVKFNDFGLFDTSYQTYFYHSKKRTDSTGYKFSNILYYQKDTMEYLYSSGKNDTVQELEFSESKISSKYEDLNDFFNESFIRTRITNKAQGGDDKKLKLSVIYKNGLTIAVDTYDNEGDYKREYCYMRIYSVIDSLYFEGFFKYTGQTKNMLETFQDIFNSSCISRN